MSPSDHSTAQYGDSTTADGTPSHSNAASNLFPSVEDKTLEAALGLLALPCSSSDQGGLRFSSHQTLNRTSSLTMSGNSQISLPESLQGTVGSHDRLHGLAIVAGAADCRPKPPGQSSLSDLADVASLFTKFDLHSQPSRMEPDERVMLSECPRDSSMGEAPSTQDRLANTTNERSRSSLEIKTGGREDDEQTAGKDSQTAQPTSLQGLSTSTQMASGSQDQALAEIDWDAIFLQWPHETVDRPSGFYCQLFICLVPGCEKKKEGFRGVQCYLYKEHLLRKHLGDEYKHYRCGPPAIATGFGKAFATQGDLNKHWKKVHRGLEGIDSTMLCSDEGITQNKGTKRLRVLAAREEKE